MMSPRNYGSMKASRISIFFKLEDAKSNTNSLKKVLGYTERSFVDIAITVSKKDQWCRMKPSHFLFIKLWQLINIEDSSIAFTYQSMGLQISDPAKLKHSRPAI